MGRMGQAACEPMRCDVLLLFVFRSNMYNVASLHVHRCPGRGSHVLRGLGPSCLLFRRIDSCKHLLLEVGPSGGSLQALSACPGSRRDEHHAHDLRGVLGTRGTRAVAQQLTLARGFLHHHLFRAPASVSRGYAGRASCRA